MGNSLVPGMKIKIQCNNEKYKHMLEVRNITDD
jgi:hypothetical protein